MAYAGITANNAVQLFKDFASALPDGRYGVGRRRRCLLLLCPGPRPDPAHVRQAHQGDGRDPGARSTRRGPALLHPERRRYGDAMPDPYAIYGYEAALRLALDAIECSGSGEKADIVQRRPATTADRESVLGTYSIDPDGDTTLTDYGVYGIEGGELVFQQTVEPQLD